MERAKIKNKQPIQNGVAKVPVIMQMEALECGAASLAMVLAYYDKWIPLEQVRIDCGVSRDGSNAKNVMEAAKNYGLDGAAYKMEPEDLRKHGRFPCIIHWNFNHFVVLDGFKGDKAILNDPARGVYPVSMDVFDESFTGICMMFQPGPRFKPGGKPKSVLKFALSRMAGTGGIVAIVLVTSLISAMIGIIQPAFSAVFLDRILTNRNPEWTIPFFGILIGVSIAQIIVEWVSAITSARISAKLDAVGNTGFLWKVLHLPMEFFSQRLAGDIQQRQDTNGSIAHQMVYTVTPLLLNTVMTVLYLVVMLRISLVLTAVGIVAIAVNLVVSRIISKKRTNIIRLQMRDSGKLYSSTVTGIEMIETIKASGAENGFFEKWAGYQASVNASTVKFSKLNQYLGMIPSVVSALADAAVVLIGIFLTIRGQFTPGLILTFQGYLLAFTDPATSLIEVGQTIQEMRTDMERVEDVMQYPDDPVFHAPKVKKGESYAKLTGNIEMRNVTFGYSKLQEPLIKDFNLTLKPGRRVAFVGSSGCGKSTLAKLISGLNQPWSGEILFDGKPLSKIDHNVFTGSVAVVDQDIILFEDTIENNIKMWDQSIEDFEMIMAARDAQIHDDIMQRDGGYQHKLIEGGRDFSGGQRQRIEIARVLAQDPTVIIMDEATSALDAKTEYEVVKCIEDRGIACVVVAHRLSTIRDCDEIIVMDRGNVVERGTHEQLMAMNGLYTQLVASD